MSIGGYFELELQKGYEYHKRALRLNSARNSLLYSIKLKKYIKIYIPEFICDSITDILKKNKIYFEFYRVDNKLEPMFDFSLIKENECFLYINYFGLKDSFVLKIKSIKNLIIDNSQSFFSKPIKNIITFYSPRKFFGVPDGSYLYIDCSDKIELDNSYSRCSHLLMRSDGLLKEGYVEFKKNEKEFKNYKILEMSNLSKKILDSINYSYIKTKRINNYNFLYKSLYNLNENNFLLEKNNVPLIYPFYSKNKKLRKQLISENIYIPFYWENCKNLKISNNLFAIPIDHRYNINNMEKIIKVIKKSL